MHHSTRHFEEHRCRHSGPRHALRVALLTAVFALGSTLPATAQEGHPLKGSWLGEWAGNSVHGDNILLILDWDGKAITGMINPGTDNIPLSEGIARAGGLGRQARSRGQGQGRQRGALRHRRQAREPRAAESLDQSARGRATRAAALSRRAGNESPRSPSPFGCAGVALRSAARWPSRTTRSTAKFDETKPTGAARHRHQRRLAQSARARVHQRHTRERRHRELGRRAREHGACSSAAAGQHDTLRPGDAIDVSGPAARDGSRQVWGESVMQSRRRSARSTTSTTPDAESASQSPRPTPRCADGKPLLGFEDARGGYWAYPSSTVLDAGRRQRADERATACSRGSPTRRASRRFNRGRSASIEHRQQRHLATIPVFLNCKAPGAVRQFQTPYGVQFVEDPARQRIFVLIGGGNRNYHIIYMDGRDQQGQVQGDDDNPLYYGRAVAPLGRRYVGRRERPASTRTSGSPTAACRTRTSCRSSSVSRAPTTTRCAMRSRSTILAPTRSPGRAAGSCAGSGAKTCPCISVRTTARKRRSLAAF